MPDTLAHIILFGVVNGSDDLCRPLPWIGQLLLVDSGKNNIERLAEPAEHLVLPLYGERRGAQDKNALNRLAKFQLLYQEPGHDCLAGSRIIRQQKPQSGLRKHCLVHRFDLVRQGTNSRKAYGKLLIVGVGQTHARRLDQESKFLGVHRSFCFSFVRPLSKDSHDLFRGDDGLFQ